MKSQLMPHPLPGDMSQRLSQRLDLQFPYDWSNSKMSEDVLINKVLEKSRFEDVMRVAYYYGFLRINQTANQLYNGAVSVRLSSILKNIEVGFLSNDGPDLSNSPLSELSKPLVIDDQITFKDIHALMRLMKDGRLTIKDYFAAIDQYANNNDHEYYKAVLRGDIPLDPDDEGWKSVGEDIVVREIYRYVVREIYRYFTQIIDHYEQGLAKDFIACRSGEPD